MELGGVSNIAERVAELPVDTPLKVSRPCLGISIADLFFKAEPRADAR